MFFFQSDYSDDYEYDYIVDHNYHKREIDVPVASQAVQSQKDALTECDDPKNSPTTQNSARTATELPSSNQILHAISNRDPRCRKRAIESENQSDNAIHMEEEKDEADVEKGDVDEDKDEENEQTLADDEDVLDIFGDDDDFDEQREITDSRPKRARIEVDQTQTAKVVVSQQSQSSKPANQIVERPILPAGPFKIPKVTKNNTQVTIKNDFVSKPIPQTVMVVRQNGAPLQPSTSIDNTRMNERIPVKQRLGLLNGTDPGQLARTVNENRSVQGNIAATPKPSTPADTASRNRILQASQRLLMRSQQTEVNLAVPVATAEKPCSSKEYVMPSFVTNPLENQPAFNVLFRNVCRKYIGDKCTLPPAGCSFSHILPDVEHLRAKLDGIGPKNAVAVYDLFVVRSKNLFTRFVPVFCDYFGTHKLEASLQQIISDCCHPERRMFQFFPHIVDGYLKMGKSFDMALRKLIPKVPKRTPQSNNVILKLILDERNTKLELFFNVLATLANQEGFYYPVESVNRIVRIFVSNTDHNEDLMMIIWTVLLKVPMSQQQRIDSELLCQFYDKASSKLGLTLPPYAKT